jgi:hypothetical protein
MTVRPISPAIALSLIGLVVGACGPADPDACEPQNAFPACDQIVISVGLQESAMTEGSDYSVEMLGKGWPIDAALGSGVLTPEAASGAEVVLFRTSDCRALLQFTAYPGSAWVIEIGADGVDHRLRDPGEAIEMGPGIEAGAPSGCDDE